MEGERERERERCWLIWQHCPRGLPWPCGRAVGMWFLSSVATLHAVLYEVVVRYGTVLSTTLVLHKELFTLLFTTAGSAQCTFAQQIPSIFRAMYIHIFWSCSLVLRDCKVCRPIDKCLAQGLANYGPQWLLIRSPELCESFVFTCQFILKWKSYEAKLYYLTNWTQSIAYGWT